MGVTSRTWADVIESEQLPDLVDGGTMRRYEVLFVYDDCVTTVPVPDALRGGGFRLHIAHGFHELAAHCGQRVDVIVILSQHHAIEWIARLKLLRNSVPVVVVCTGAQ